MFTTIFTSVRAAIGLAAAALFIAIPLFAQTGGRGQGSPRYDLATEATVTGTVESVEHITGATAAVAVVVSGGPISF